LEVAFALTVSCIQKLNFIYTSNTELCNITLYHLSYYLILMFVEKNGSYVFECVSFQEVQGKAPGTIVVVSKIGYKLHERVIRPALVGVAKGP
jgi:hypothetical protein